MESRTSLRAPWALATTVATVIGLVAATSPSEARTPDAASMAGASVNGGFITYSNYVGLDGVVRVLPEPFDPDSSMITGSPDGTAIAFTTSPGSPTENEKLWVLESGSEPRLVAMLGDGAVERLAWSPDGSRIAVESLAYRPGQGTMRAFLDVVTVADGTRTPLVSTTTQDIVFLDGITWSADSARIAVIAVDGESYTSDIRWVPADGGAVTSLTHFCTWSRWTPDCDASEPGTGVSQDLDLSPDGSTFLTVDDRKVVRLDAATGEETPLGLSGEHPVWSPDGTRFAYVTSRKVSGVWQNLAYTVDDDGSNPTLATVDVGGVMDWQPCTQGSCPSFGTPRGQTHLGEVTSSRTARYLDVELTVQPSGPDRDWLPDGPFVLQRRTASGWKAVRRGATDGATDYTYALRLRRPAAGKCRLKFSYPGDPWSEPAKLKTPKMAC